MQKYLVLFLREREWTFTSVTLTRARSRSRKVSTSNKFQRMISLSRDSRGIDRLRVPLRAEISFSFFFPSFATRCSGSNLTFLLFSFFFFFNSFMNCSFFTRGFFFFIFYSPVDTSIRSIRDGAQKWVLLERHLLNLPDITGYPRNLQLSKSWYYTLVVATKSDYSHRRDQSRRHRHSALSFPFAIFSSFLSCKSSPVDISRVVACMTLCCVQSIAFVEEQRESTAIRLETNENPKSKNAVFQERKRERERENWEKGGGENRMKYSCIFHTTRVALRWSYRALNPETRWIFRTYVMSITEKRYSFIWFTL